MDVQGFVQTAARHIYNYILFTYCNADAQTARNLFQLNAELLRSQADQRRRPGVIILKHGHSVCKPSLTKEAQPFLCLAF